MNAPREDKSISTLLSDLTREITTLFRQEVLLVKTEISEKAGQAQSGLTSIVVGGAVAYAGVLVLLIAAVLGLSLIMPAWLAAFLVAVVVLVIGMSMIGKGKNNLRARNLMPRKSVESLQRDKQVAREHTK
jgi:uncharacterized membrane protein